ncbi:Malonyl-[acyl-carrier protein] O-methyltransferase [Roseovarius albus]|uniref:Malonyl-[acyl-carrier protein] O-methyltransferase n=1 Tax=Roseovarius albus TaxID=1247867 RepID=A0A1X6YVE1_9RHOB|nr:class I SAM-dependent methyltransferase [Roseovarius albus]SLN31716.1 Malonyl-[acyl-carrier protein] O-methyltransferase [Roseovarius albus]
MSENELPDTKAGRVDWVIRAETNEEMRRRYDLWAQDYDSDVGSYDDYLVPWEATKVAEIVLSKEALILDAGAGTGLVGQTLKEAGFQRLIAVDYSEGMLDIARKKQVYEDVHQCDLSRPTQFETGSIDCVITCGTTTQMPCASLREFARIVRPKGKIIFAVVPDAWVDFGYADILSELEAQGKLSVKSRGEPFQMLPTTEPDFYCEIWVIDVR